MRAVSPVIEVSKVVSEDPWSTEKLYEIVTPDEYAFEAFDKLVEAFENAGYVCSDHGSASVQLCVGRGEKLLIKVVMEGGN